MRARAVHPIAVSAALHVAVICGAALLVTTVDAEPSGATLTIASPGVAVALVEPAPVAEPPADLPERHDADPSPFTEALEVTETSLPAWEEPAPTTRADAAAPIALPGARSNVRFRAARRIAAPRTTTPAASSMTRPVATRPAATPAVTWTAPVDDVGNRAPSYPVFARRRGLEGVVEVALGLDATGMVTAVAIVQTSGHELLDDAAVATVADWTFEPARRGDVAAPATIRRRVRFELR